MDRPSGQRRTSREVAYGISDLIAMRPSEEIALELMAARLAARRKVAAK